MYIRESWPYELSRKHASSVLQVVHEEGSRPEGQSPLGLWLPQKWLLRGMLSAGGLKCGETGYTLFEYLERRRGVGSVVKV